MPLTMQTALDEINVLISQNKDAEAAKKLAYMPFDLPLPSSVIALWEKYTEWAIRENEFDILFNLASRVLADVRLKSAFSKAMNNPSNESYLLANFSDEQVSKFILYVDKLNSNLMDRWPNKWLENDQDDYYMAFMYSLGYYSDKTLYFNQAIEQGSLNTLALLLIWEPKFYAQIGNDKLKELIKLAFENNKFVFLFSIMNAKDHSHLISDDLREKIREKIHRINTKGIKLGLHFAPQNFPLDISLILKIIEDEDWANLINIMKIGRPISNVNQIKLSENDVSKIKQLLLTRFGTNSASFIKDLEWNFSGVDYLIPSIEGQTYCKRIQTKPWIDLLPVEAYFVNKTNQPSGVLNEQAVKPGHSDFNIEEMPPGFDINAFREGVIQKANASRLPFNDKTNILYNKMKEYHLIPKDKKENILPRFEALWEIQQAAQFLVNDNTYTQAQQIYLNDIAINCQNKSKYLMKLKGMPKKAKARLFRTEHSQGDLLRVDNPLFPSLTASENPQTAYNQEVLSDLDPYYRYIPVDVFAQWFAEATGGVTTADLWLWLENHPEINLAVNDHYLVPKDTFKVEFDKQSGKLMGTLINGKKGVVLDGNSCKFNIDRSGHLHADFNHLVSNHSHLVKGGILSAGMITFKDGLITNIDNSSGHYFPHRRHLLAGLRHLMLPLEAFSPEAKVSCYDAKVNKVVEIGLVSEFLHQAPPSKPPVAEKAETTERPSGIKRKSYLPQQQVQDSTVQAKHQKTIPFTKATSHDDFSRLIEGIEGNNSQMTHVSFAYCGFAGWAQEKITNALPSNTWLHSLDITGAALVNETFPQFLEALQKNNSLEYLVANDINLETNNLRALTKICEEKNIKFECNSLRDTPTLD